MGEELRFSLTASFCGKNRSNCFIGHGVMFTNDLFKEGSPAHGDTDLYKPTIIGAMSRLAQIRPSFS